MAQTDIVEQTGEKDFYTADRGFAAYLMTKFMFMGAIDTGRPLGKNRPGTQKEFSFLIPADLDIEQELYDYQNGKDSTMVPAVVMVNKMRLTTDHIKRPIDINAVKA